MLAEQVTDPIAEHGESPVWAPAWGGLRWVDLAAGDVLALDASGAIRRRSVGRLATAIRPGRDGRTMRVSCPPGDSFMTTMLT